MRRKEFEQLRGLIFEIESLAEKYLTPDERIEVIFYNDYRTGKAKPKVDVGSDFGAAAKERIEARLKVARERRLEMIEEMEEFLDSVDDATMRTILRYYYRDGMTQDAIGEMIGYSREGIRWKIDNFWRKQEEE